VRETQGFEPFFALRNLSFAKTGSGQISQRRGLERKSGLRRPELKAFSRVHSVAPGESRRVVLTLGWRELSVLRAEDLERVVEASARTVFVGGGQPHEFASGVSAEFATVL